MDFKGKVVLITGASSGIGVVTAEYFASLGAKLSLTGRNESNLKKLVEDCKKANSKSEQIYIVADVTKESDIENIVKDTIKKYGRLDVLINNAGVGQMEPLETLTLETFDLVQNTNVRSVLYLTKLAMPYLIESKGNIVNISSAVSVKAGVGLLAYRMSKAALDQFTKCVALELAPKNIRVNSVNPGGIKTYFMGRMGVSEDVYDKMHEIHPIGRIGTCQEVANTIAFIASDMASNVTGSILFVDGGLSIS